MATSTKTAKSKRRGNANGKQTDTHHIYDDVLALVESFAWSRKEGMDKLQSLAGSTRDFASASMKDMPNFREQMSSAGESLENLAEYVMHTNVENMLEDAATFVRRRPLAVLTVTVIGGLAVSRFLRPPPMAGKTVSARRKTAQSKIVPSRRKPAAKAPHEKNGKAAHA
jgi:hypothetical protein